MEKKSKIRKFDWERFLITVMGTAIGVALTFVVNGRVARHNKEQAQRLTAIMVIHDIDNTIDLLKDWKKEEEKQDDLLRFALEQRDRLEGLSSDTLNTILEYLKAINIDFRFDTSKEKIFNSDLDTWQNLGNMAFLDNVQDFYHARQSFQDGVNHSTMWTGPIPDEDYMQFVMGTGWVTEEEFAAALRPFLKEKLYETQVVYYINISGTRVTSLGQWIDHWTRMNNEN
ncbi:MAG: hypothetical protein K6G79_02310 [Bacteroidales bacterium]|nr:hypothetical protein [Bacteroidales bacterium]